MNLPLPSSKQLIAVLKKDGFLEKKPRHGKKKKKGGSHRNFIKRLPDGKARMTVVILNKKQYTPTALKSVLKQAGISEERYLELFKKKK